MTNNRWAKLTCAVIVLACGSFSRDAFAQTGRVPADATVGEHSLLCADAQANSTEQSNYADPFSIPPERRARTRAEHDRLGELMRMSTRARAGADYAAAIEALREALDISVRSHGSTHVVTSLVMSNLANMLYQAGQIGEAEQIQRRTLSIRQASLRGDHPLIASILSDLSATLEARMALDEAESTARQSLEMRLRMFGPTHRDTASSYNNLGVALKSQGRWNEALSMFLCANNTYVRTGARAWDAHSPSMNVVNTLYLLGRYAEAEQLSRQIVQSALATYGPDHLTAAEAQSELALILSESASQESELNSQRRAQMLQESEQLFGDAAALFRRRLGETHPSYAIVLNNWAIAARENGDIAQAQTLTRQALRIFESRLGVDHESTLLLRANLAATLLRAGQNYEALQVARPLVLIGQATEVNRIAPSFGGLRRHDTPTRRRAALVITRALWSDNAQPPALQEAFRAMQQSGSTTASSLAALAQQETLPTEARTAIDRILAAQHDVYQADAALHNAIGIGLPSEIQQQALSTRSRAVRQQEAAQALLLRNAADIQSFLVPSPLTSAQLQSCLGPDSALLHDDEALVLLTPGSMEMPAGHHRGFVFVVTKNCADPSQSRVAWAELGLEPDALAREIDSLRGDLDIYRNTRAFEPAPQGGPRTVRQPRFDRTRAHALYQALFGDPEVAALLASKPNWLIAPQGNLLSLPFAALVTEAPAGGAEGDADAARLRSTHWLGLERTLSILPAVSSLATLRRDIPTRTRPAQIAFFGVGDPVFAGAPDSQRSPTNGIVRSGSGTEIVRLLPRLPATRDEIEAMRRSLEGEARDVLLGAQASEPSLRAARDRLARARVVTFATHGLLAGDLSLAEPALALTPPQAGVPRPNDPRAAAEDDGLLTASEAAFLPLSAEWVILSACNTAAGDGTAEGLSGLARAFFYAGARSLLVSQWRVRDDAAARLTTRAIALTQTQGRSKAEALREAMLEVISDTSQDATGHSFAHPAAWAPFIFVGAN